MRSYRKLFWLTLFAIAMANVEAVVVVYLRTVYYPDDPTALFPLSFLSERDLWIEMTREVATLLMILAVAALAGKRFIATFATFVYVFGVWDVFYYAWLKLMIGWPTTWSEWDVLFLIPWPWLGPWIAPVLVALLFAIWGGWVLARNTDARLSRKSAVLFVAGSSFVLASFLSPAFPLLSGGEDAFQGYRPDGFPWIVFVPGYLMMVTGLCRLATGPRAA